MTTLTNHDKFAYQRVRDTIETMLLHGELAVGDRLPPIRELAERFNCNYHTVRKGLETLIQEALLESRTGSGVFVRAGSRTIPSAAPGTENILAVVCHPPVQPTDTQFIASLHEQAEKRQLHLEFHTVSSFAQPRRIFDRIAVRGCLAVLLPLLRSDDHIEEIAACIRDYPMPFVVGSPFPGLEPFCYESPGIYGVSTRLAIEAEFLYFHRLGFTNIALLLPAAEAVKTVSNHLVPYAKACAAAGVEPLLESVERLPGAMEGVLDSWSRMRGDLAVICYDDEVALRLINAVRARNWCIPDDLALAGLGNTLAGAEARPPLTSVHFPYDYVTTSTIDCALALAAGRSAQRTTPIWQPIVIRESCGGIRRIGCENAEKLLQSIKEQLLTPDERSRK